MLATRPVTAPVYGRTWPWTRKWLGMYDADMRGNRLRSLLKAITLGWYGRKSTFHVMQMDGPSVNYTTGTKWIGWDGQPMSVLTNKPWGGM
jgi:hypothetical protein